MIENAAVVWIDTDGKFKILGCDSIDEAYDKDEIISECGLPTTVISRNRLVSGDNDDKEDDEEPS